MGYVKATNVLPKEILEQIQNYIEGEIIYIPKRAENKQSWGANTKTKQFLVERNREIYQHYLNGVPVLKLSEQYFLVEKSIRRIIAQQKKLSC